MPKSLLFTSLCLFVSLSYGQQEAIDLNTYAVTVCDSLADVEQKIQFTSSEEKRKILGYRSEVQSFIKNAIPYIEQKKQANELADLAVACALVDDATESFTKSCYDDQGLQISTTEISAACEQITKEIVL